MPDHVPPDLIAAVEHGDADEVATALRAGADPEQRDDQGRTPLLIAATHDRVAVAELLVAVGADPDALDGRHDTPWLVTGVTGGVAMGEALLAAGADRSIADRDGVSALEHAEASGQSAVAGLLRG